MPLEWPVVLPTARQLDAIFGDVYEPLNAYCNIVEFAVKINPVPAVGVIQAGIQDVFPNST
jgi:hypothetical protein